MTKVEMIYPQGYCAGVKNAISVAKQSKIQYPDKNIFILGNLVHNQIVIKALEKMGISTIYDDFENALKELPSDSVVIFPAHGHDEKYDLIAKQRGLIVLDAVCFKVKQNAAIIKEYVSKGHQVIYIGINNHPETVACLSIDKNVILYDINKEFDFSQIKDEAPLVINQTTLNILELTHIHDEIKSHFARAIIQNEICNSTRKRQEAIVNLDKDVDLIVIVGDKASSNTNRLLEIAKSSHPNAESYLVSNVGELDKNVIINKNHIAISSGASTPTETINMVYEEIVNTFAK